MARLHPGIDELQSITTFDEFRAVLPHPVAYRVGGEVFPFRVPSTDLNEVVAQARAHPKARIASGQRGDRLLLSLDKPATDFRALPLGQAVQTPIHLSLFDLGPLRAPGGALAGAIEQVYLPLTRLWQEQGLSWEKAYPILFLSGPGCSTNYHWDPTSVLVVQLHGRKRYYSLKDPRRWLPDELLGQGHEAKVRPPGLTDDDILSVELAPGQAIWNPQHAPHWLDAYDETAYTLSISFGNIQPRPDPEAQMVVA